MELTGEYAVVGMRGSYFVVELELVTDEETAYLGFTLVPAELSVPDEAWRIFKCEADRRGAELAWVDRVGALLDI